jgi:hypothetical protein
MHQILAIYKEKYVYLGVHAVHTVWKDPGERVPRLSALRDLHGLPVPAQGTPGPERLRRQGHLQRVHTGLGIIKQTLQGYF